MPYKSLGTDMMHFSGDLFAVLLGDGPAQWGGLLHLGHDLRKAAINGVTMSAVAPNKISVPKHLPYELEMRVVRHFQGCSM